MTMKDKKLPVIVAGYKESHISITEQVHPEGKEKKFYIEGLAIPFNTVSSNGVLYTKESLIETAPLWVGLPIMYNHMVEGTQYPVGKVVEMKPGVLDNKEGMLYRAEIDLQENVLIGKIKGGYLSKVSIHILPSDITGKEGYQEAVVGRPLELSIVPVPGFAETNMASYVEKLNKDVGEQNMTENVENKPTSSNTESVVDNKVESLKQDINKIKHNYKELLGIVEELVDSEEDTELIGNVAEQEATINDIVEILTAITNRLERIEEVMKKLEEDEEPTAEESPVDEPVEVSDEKPSEEVKDSAMPLEPEMEEKLSQETKKETVETETAEEVIVDEIDMAKQEAIKNTKNKESIRLILRDL